MVRRMMLIHPVITSILHHLYIFICLLIIMLVASTTIQPSQQPVTPPPKLPITLPIPLNSKTNKYTKPEAAEILFHTTMGSRVRAEAMNQMILLGYTPPNKRSLQRLMKKRDAGYVVADTPWIVIKPNKAVAKSDGGCNGIQSMNLENNGKK